jgi:hypothetical protein
MKEETLHYFKKLKSELFCGAVHSAARFFYGMVLVAEYLL